MFSYIILNLQFTCISRGEPSGKIVLGLIYLLNTRKRGGTAQYFLRVELCLKILMKN